MPPFQHLVVDLWHHVACRLRGHDWLPDVWYGQAVYTREVCMWCGAKRPRPDA